LVHPGAAMTAILRTVLFALLASCAAAAESITLGSHEATTRVAMSVDGAIAASTGDKTIKLWDVTTGQLLRTLPIETNGIALAFTPDARAIAVRVERGVDLLDVDSGKTIRRFEAHTDGIPRIAISPDGQWLASGGSDNKARVWEITSGKLVFELPHQYHLVFGVQFSADSQRLVTGGGDGVATHGEVILWDVRTGMKLWRYEGKQIWMVAVLTDRRVAVSADVEGTIVLHDGETGAVKRQFKTSDVCRALAVSANGKWLAASARRKIETWNLGTGQAASILEGHQNWVGSLAFTPDASALISGSSDNTVRLWRLR
jgi:WD40 repeat protein